MPSGRTHDRITLWSLPWVAGFAYLITRNGELTLIAMGAFLFSGLMFGPDLDIYSVQYKRWGKLRWIWRPYQLTIAHRSTLSHGAIVGTLLRVSYLLSWLTVAGILGVTVAQSIWGFNWNWQQFFQNATHYLTRDYLKETIVLLTGLELGAMSHSLSDWLGSVYKRRRVKALKSQKPRKRKSTKRQK